MAIRIEYTPGKPVIVFAILAFLAFQLPQCLANAPHCACADSYYQETGSDVGPFYGGESSSDGSLVVYLAALLPNTTSHPFSMARARPAVDIAVLQLQKLGIFKRNTIKVIYKDSACSTTTGPLAAFNLRSARRVHVFLGPVCDFPLAAVARYSAVWNIPVLTPGAFAHDFGMPKNGEKVEFLTLTRMGANFNSLSMATKAVLSAHSWQKVTILYEVKGFPEMSENFCYLAVSAIVFYSKRANQPYDFHLFDPENYDPEVMLVEKVGLKYGGKSGEFLSGEGGLA